MKEYHIVAGPFQKSKQKTSSMMSHVLLALIPIVLFSFYKNGILPYQKGYGNLWNLFYPLFFIGIPIITSYCTEYIGARFFLKKKDIKAYMQSSYAILPGLFLGLILPIHTPLLIVVFGAMIATIIGKLIYGGFGNNLFNPALIGRLFVITIYAGVIASHGGYHNAYEADTISQATPLSNIATVEGIGTYDTLVKPYGNLWNFFIGTIPGAVGETSAFFCIIGFLYLTWKKIIKWRIPVFYITTVFLLTTGIGIVNGLSLWYPLFQILSGGLFFGSIFMATDPVTSPVTKNGQLLYGIGLGILTVVFRYFTSYPEGVLTSILTMNMMVFLMDKLGNNFRKKENQIFILAIIISLCGFIIYQWVPKNSTTQVGDPNFSIIAVQEVGNQVIYKVSQKGNGGPITCEVIIQNGKAIKMEVVEQHETPSYYTLVEQASYIKTLIKEQTRLKELDTISGATISSNALKKLLINTLQEYEGTYEK